MQTKTIPGPVYVALAALMWSMAGLLTKYVPWQPLSIACVRSVTAALTVGIIRRKFFVKINRATLLAGLCLFATTVLFICSNKLTTAANAVVLQFSSPVYVILGTAILNRKRPRAAELLAVALTIGGVALFFLDHLGQGHLAGDLMALLAGVTFAGVFFFNCLPGASPMDGCFLGCALSIVFLPALLTDPSVRTGGWKPWVVVLILGVFQLGIAYMAFAKGIQSTGAVTSSIICGIEPILNPIWVFLVLGERPGNLAIVGAAVVILTISLYNIWLAKSTQALKAREAEAEAKMEINP